MVPIYLCYNVYDTNENLHNKIIIMKQHVLFHSFKDADKTVVCNFLFLA